MKVKLYIEGGGDSHLQDTLFRRGWKSIFEKAGLQGRMPSTFRGGGWGATFEAFKTAWKHRREGECPVLLVDSEAIPPENVPAWDFLKQRDSWDRPEGAADRTAFLMICCMETWFVADQRSLSQFFGDCWRDSAVPAWQDLEAVSKEPIFKALDNATKECGKKRYAKGKLSFELLSVIEPAQVRQRCPAAGRLLDCLDELCR